MRGIAESKTRAKLWELIFSKKRCFGMSFQEKLANYARLVVRHGMNVQQGQVVSIKGEIIHRDFLYEIARESYLAGAKYVQLDFLEPRLTRLRHEVSSVEDLKYVPKYVTARFDELLEEAAATASVVGQEDPDFLADCDPVRVNTSRMAGYQAAKRFYEEGIGKSKVHWTVVAAATPAWAKRVFPDLPSDQALNRLWEELFRICRVDQPNFLEAWHEHNERLHRRADHLSKLGIRTLHFSGPETNLTVGLSDRARFKGGTDVGPHGVPFEPNLPTEECFTTPDWRVTEGVAQATRPFYLNGKLIEELVMRFEKGEIVEFSAKSGEAVFREYISSDPGAKRLGEVALVGIDSPIYQSGLVFQDTLLDENAACHIAIGSAYKFCLEGGDDLSKEELEAIGCNESSVHSDIMISSDRVNVTAKTTTGDEVTLIESGRWLID